jgi:hypothetical protein
MKLNEWFVSGYTSNGATCVETKFTVDTVLVRDNHCPEAGTITFAHGRWGAFIAHIKDGAYDI